MSRYRCSLVSWYVVSVAPDTSAALLCWVECVSSDTDGLWGEFFLGSPLWPDTGWLGVSDTEVSLMPVGFIEVGPDTGSPS